MTTAMEPMLLDTCPDCEYELRLVAFTEPALVRAGGYGASRRTTKLRCEQCGWSTDVEITEVSPRQ